jgi:hypothetical protein
MASIWNSTVDWPGWVRTLAGICSDPLELERRTSAAVSCCTFRIVIRHFPAEPAARLVELQERLPVEGAAVIVNDAAELLPLKVAVTIAAPNAVGCEVASKLAPVLPWRTITVAGTVTAELLLDRLIVRSPAGFETVTIQVFLDPAARLAERQVTEDTTGRDHKFRVALCEELPSLAFTEAVPSAAMVPTPTAKVAAALPPATVTLAGMVI